jgi:hypothetical protein
VNHVPSQSVCGTDYLGLISSCMCETLEIWHGIIGCFPRKHFYGAVNVIGARWTGVDYVGLISSIDMAWDHWLFSYHTFLWYCNIGKNFFVVWL